MGRKGWTIAILTCAGAAGLVLSVFRFSPPTQPAGPIVFREVTHETGILFKHTDGSSGRRYIIEPMSAGLALFDYDGDGRIDIYFLNGAPLLGTKVDVPPRNVLYRNEGQWRFRDVTEQAGVANGTIAGAGASFLDVDSDGGLDLYVANYLEFSYDMQVERVMDGTALYPSPRDYLPVPDTLYRNDGDGTFTDISQESGISSCAGTGMGMVCADYDYDGDTDVFVLNDVAENFFFRNDGTGKFEEVGMVIGIAYNFFGEENASMGVDCGDYDNDGQLDFYMTSYQEELPVLYRNVGDGLLEDGGCAGVRLGFRFSTS